MDQSHLGLAPVFHLFGRNRRPVRGNPLERPRSPGQRRLHEEIPIDLRRSSFQCEKVHQGRSRRQRRFTSVDFRGSRGPSGDIPDTSRGNSRSMAWTWESSFFSSKYRASFTASSVTAETACARFTGPSCGESGPCSSAAYCRWRRKRARSPYARTNQLRESRRTHPGHV